MPNTSSEIRRSSCMDCNSRSLVAFMDLGLQPNGNSYPTPETRNKELLFPMKMLVCGDCWQVQLDEFPPQELLFSDHPYVTGTNIPVVEHFKRMAEHVAAKLGLAPQSLVFDIGCNDGTLLKCFRDRGMRVLGFDPSLRVGRLAQSEGITVCRAFWNEATGSSIRDLGLVPDLITATAVFYHVPDLHDFVRGLRAAMGQHTTFVVQCVYLKDLIEKNEFDHFYHEHSCIHAVTPLKRLFEAHGMRIIDVEFVDIHGGSFLAYVGDAAHPLRTSENVQRAIDAEATAGLLQLQTYERFVDRVQKNGDDLVRLLRQIRARGQRVYGLGAPVKGSTLLNYFKIGPDLVQQIVELNRFKIDRLTPGTHIPIVDENKIDNPPDYYLILAWNFVDYLIEKYRDYLLNGGKFIVPCPELRVIGADDLARRRMTERGN